MRTLRKLSSHASGDIGPILFCVLIVTVIMALEFSFGYDQFMQRFESGDTPQYEDEPLTGLKKDEDMGYWERFLDYWGGVVENIANILSGFANVLGIFWDLMTFNIEAVEGFPVVLRILLSLPIWVCFFYMGAKIIRGF